MRAVIDRLEADRNVEWRLTNAMGISNAMEMSNADCRMMEAASLYRFK